MFVSAKVRKEIFFSLHFEGMPNLYHPDLKEGITALQAPQNPQQRHKTEDYWARFEVFDVCFMQRSRYSNIRFP